MKAILKKISRRKYQPDKLVAMFRKAAALRNEMLEEGFTDNGGAIHSAERILNILGMALKYPNLTHINNLKNFAGAEFSIEARKAHLNGEKVLIEHVAPLRHLTRTAIEKVSQGMSDSQFKRFLGKHYRLVLLSTAETQILNRQNRSSMALDRMGEAGIKMVGRKTSKARP